MDDKPKESDLYLPIKHFLNKLDYEVKGEIKSCDIVAIKGNEIIVIELKLTLNITLLLQSIDRFSLTDIVYIAIPKQSTIFKNKKKQVKKLVARLGLGLIVVDIQKTKKYVEVIHDPKDYSPAINKRQKIALLKEFNQRQGDPQKGGSTTKKAGLTAYRQRCIRIATYLINNKYAKGMDIKSAIDEPQATAMLNKNYYNWFNKTQRGVYELSQQGQKELPYWQEKMNAIV